VFTGLWTAGETLSFALGPGLVLAVLAISGFVSSRADEQVTQPDEAITGIVVAFAAFPAVLVALSLPLVLRYARVAPDPEGLAHAAPHVDSATPAGSAPPADTAPPAAPPTTPGGPS
jgi:hypothetical protein